MVVQLQTKSHQLFYFSDIHLEIRSQARSLVDQLLVSELPADLRTQLIDNVKEIINAIEREYVACGPSKLEEKLNQQMGWSVRMWEHFREFSNEPAIKGFLNLLSIINGVLKLDQTLHMTDSVSSVIKFLQGHTEDK